jgi:menaquinol-cytochrome c reductase iron-sulfur subunit
MAAEPPDARRAFLKLMTTGLGALVGALAIIPGLGFLANPLRRNVKSSRGAGSSLRVAGEREVVAGKPLRVNAVGPHEDAWLRMEKVTLGSLWLVRTVEDGPIKAFSTICPHLGCGIDFDDKAGKFNCPCHASAFDLDGRCLGGPSPRALDELDTHVEGRDVLVRYQRFRVGSSKREPLG